MANDQKSVEAIHSNANPLTDTWSRTLTLERIILHTVAIPHVEVPLPDVDAGATGTVVAATLVTPMPKTMTILEESLVQIPVWVTAPGRKKRETEHGVNESTSVIEHSSIQKKSIEKKKKFQQLKEYCT